MKKVWGIFWLIIAALGGRVLYDLLRFQSESGNAVIFGLSKQKLLLCAAVLAISLVSLIGAILSFLNKKNIFSSGKLAGFCSHVILLALIAGVIFLNPPVGNTAFERSLKERLLPLAYWGMAFVILAFILVLIGELKKIRPFIAASWKAILLGTFFMILMSGGVYYALSTGTGTDPVSRTFYRQGVSILEGHLLLPLLILYPFMFFYTWIAPRIAGKKAAVFFYALGVILVWGAAVWFWQTTEFVGRSYFAPALRPPNYNFYPSSDAENYDLLAHSILLGNGFRNGLTVVRPLYAAFLALLHFLFGNDYMKLTNGQIFLLALIPALVFAIGRRLRSTPAGLLAAAWVIWREVYSIRLTPLVQVSNSRLLMSDLPAMLAVCAVILCAVKWGRNGQKTLWAFLCGSMIGTSMLIRTQCFVLIPAVWLVFFLCGHISGKTKWKAILLSLIGVCLVYAPWYLWGRFDPDGASDPNASEGQYLVSLYRQALNEEDPGLGIPAMIIKNPGKTFEAVGSHFLNNEISSLLVLPVREQLPKESERLFFEDDLFWYRENAKETLANNRDLIILYLCVIAFGIAAAYRKVSFIGLAPLLIHFVYNLGTALALNSGFRFILPVDWILLFYFGIGCASILELLCRVLLNDFQPLDDINKPVLEKEIGTNPVIMGLAILLTVWIGSILPVVDGFIPSRFPEKSRTVIAEEWKASSPNAEMILSSHDESDLIFLEGEAFYPRYYGAGEGDSGGSSSVKQEQDRKRLVWMFHDKEVHVLNCSLTDEQAAQVIAFRQPDPIDVRVVGIPMPDHIEVLEMQQLIRGAGH